MNHVRIQPIRRGAAILAVACTLALAASCGNQAGGPSGSSDASASASAPAATSAAAPPPEAGAPEAAGEAGAPEPSSSARAPGKCPEAQAADRVVSYDWSKELGVDAVTAARLRGIGGTAVEARLLSFQVENELRVACAAMAAELGNKGVFASAPVACQAAVDALKATRTKLGQAAKIAVHVHPAVCPEAIDDMKECAKRCAGEDKAPDATCAGVTAGRCPGACDGPCEVRAAGPCDGACLGQCDSGFSGNCEGTCKGKCDGKDMKPGGECKGKCEGGCDAASKGECKGRCSGGCQLRASACAGLCTGKCSVPVTDPKCLGSVKLATGPECASYCELRAVHRMACGAAQVDVRVGGTKDPSATAYAGAIERHLPAVLKVEQQLKGRIDSLNKARTTVADGLKAITAGGSPALPALSQCVFSYDKATVEGVTSLLEAWRAVNDVGVAARAK